MVSDSAYTKRLNTYNILDFLTIANFSRSSPNSFFILLNRPVTALQGPHHFEYTSTTITYVLM